MMQPACDRVRSIFSIDCWIRTQMIRVHVSAEKSAASPYASDASCFRSHMAICSRHVMLCSRTLDPMSPRLSIV